MGKEFIKAKLRESFMGQMRENEPAAAPVEKQDASKTNKYDKDYQDVQNKLDGTMLKQSQVMAAAGIGDPKDATARSLFSKKVRKDTNDEGGQYLFSDIELASVIKVLNNPAAYLNLKRGG